MKQTRIVTVLSAESCQSEYPSTNLEEFKVWLDEQIARIPAERMGSAEIDFNIIEEYGNSYVNVDIIYYREETDAEFKTRKVLEEKHRQTQEDIERARYLELKAKYGDES